MHYLSKYAGGLGNDWTPVRAMGSHIKGTNGKSQGVVPFLNVLNAMPLLLIKVENAKALFVLILKHGILILKNF